MSDFTHTFKQSWPIGHLQSTPAHRPPPINYGPSAFHFCHSCIAHKKHRNHKSKPRLHHHFFLKNHPLNPILPGGLKGVPKNGDDPLLKYLAPLLLFSLFWLLYFTNVRINLYLDYNSWPWIDHVSRDLKRPKSMWQDNRCVLPAAH